LDHLWRTTVFKLAPILATLLLVACDYRPSIATIPDCVPVVEAAPSSAIISLSSSVTVALNRDLSCPFPLVRNETPSILEVVSPSATTIQITGLVIGNGRVRIRSGSDTLVSTIIAVTVIP